MENKSLSAAQAAGKLDVHERTIRNWIKQYDIPAKKRAGKYLLSPDNLAVLLTVKGMIGVNGMNTIRKAIGSGLDPDPVRTRSESGEVPQAMTPSKVQEIIEKSLLQNNELSEKYARATYEIGELRNEVKHQQITIEALRSDKKALEERLMALPSPEQIQAIQTNMKALETQLARSIWVRLLTWLTGKK